MSLVRVRHRPCGETSLCMSPGLDRSELLSATATTTAATRQLTNRSAPNPGPECKCMLARNPPAPSPSPASCSPSWSPSAPAPYGGWPRFRAGSANPLPRLMVGGPVFSPQVRRGLGRGRAGTDGVARYPPDPRRPSEPTGSFDELRQAGRSQLLRRVAAQRRSSTPDLGGTATPLILRISV